MKLIDFPERNVIFAEGQPEYMPLPAYKDPHVRGAPLVCCWRLGFLERLRLLFTGRVWHSILTFNQPLQPQLLAVKRPDALPKKGSKP